MGAARRWGVVALTGVLGLACGDDSEGGSETTSGQTAGSTTRAEGTADATSSGSGSNSTSSGATTSSGTASTTDVSTTDASSDGGSTGGSTTGAGGTGAGVCEPTAGDPECFTCVKSNCCVAWSLCQDDTLCSCIVECHVVDGNSLGNCRSSCGGETELYNGVYFCGQMYCLGLCDWQSP